MAVELHFLSIRGEVKYREETGSLDSEIWIKAFALKMSMIAYSTCVARPLLAISCSRENKGSNKGA